MNQEPSMVIGAYNFKDWHTAVWVRNRNAKFPEECACCGCVTRIDSETMLLSEGTVKISYPICPMCREHSSWDEKIVAIALVLGVVIPALLYYAMFGFSFLRRGLYLTFILYIIAVVITSAAIYFPLTGRKKSYDCSGPGWPIFEDGSLSLDAILGESTVRKDEKEARLRIRHYREIGGKEAFGLQFKNHDFAKKFIELNGSDSAIIERIEDAM